jgi:hypothetical protein
MVEGIGPPINRPMTAGPGLPGEPLPSSSVVLRQAAAPVSAFAKRSVPARRPTQPEAAMTIGTILLILLILILIGALPTWPYSRGWGYYPTGGIGLIVVILLVLVLLGHV